MPPASPSGEWAHHCRGRANVRAELGLRPNKSLPNQETDMEMKSKGRSTGVNLNSRNCACHLSVYFLCTILC